MAGAPQSAYKDRQFLAVIGDEDSVTGLLLAGIGHVSNSSDNNASSGGGKGGEGKDGGKDGGGTSGSGGTEKNFLVVDAKTSDRAIEQAFERFTTGRRDIAVVLVNQHIADRIRQRVDTYTAAFPAVLEIPSKDHPYDPEKDSVLRRVRRLFGE